MSNLRKLLHLVAGVATLTMAAPLALGGGIEVPMQGARAAGQADAFTAQADDPSAIFYNPAGLTQIEGTQAMVGAYGLFPNWQFESSRGAGGESMRLSTVLPHVYFSTDAGTERWRFGFGANNAFGLNENWGNQGPLRTLVDHAKLSVLELSPTVAYRVDEHLSVGAALNVYYGELMMTRNVPLGPPPFPEASFHLRGHDWNVGVTPSVLYKIDARNSIGAYYRSPFTLNLEGSAQLGGKGIPSIGPSHAVAPLNLPQSAGIGYAVRPIDPLKLEADVIWTDWSSVNQLQVHSPDPHFDRQTIRADWKDGFTYRLGAQYDLTRNWVLRGGYAFSQNAVPSSTFNPLVPDSNYHLFSAGLGYQTERWSIDAAYEFIYRERRHINGDSINSPVVDGTWDNTINGFMLSFTMKI